MPEPTPPRMSEPTNDAGSPPTDEDERTFEELVAELEQVTETLAAGDVGIEAAADLYERARRLHTLASERLARVQERVDRISRE